MADGGSQQQPSEATPAAHPAAAPPPQQLYTQQQFEEVLRSVPDGPQAIDVRGVTAHVAPNVMFSRVVAKPPWHADSQRSQRKEMITEINVYLTEQRLGELGFSAERIASARAAHGLNYASTLLPTDWLSTAYSLSMSYERAMYYGAPDFVTYTSRETTSHRIDALQRYAEQLEMVQHMESSNAAAAAAAARKEAAAAAAAASAEGSAAVRAPGSSDAAAAAASSTIGSSEFADTLAKMLTQALVRNLPGSSASSGGTRAAGDGSKGAPAAAGAAVAVSSAPHAAGGSGARSHDMASLKAQQSTRLMQLNHAYRCRAAAQVRDSQAREPPCTAEGMQCPYFQFLWGHMERCTDSPCQVKHCVSSRFCIEHYKNCADEACEVCVPVKRSMFEGGAAPPPSGEGGGSASASGKRPLEHVSSSGVDGLMAASMPSASVPKRPRVDAGASHSHSSHLSSSSVGRSGGSSAIVGGGVPLLNGQQLEQVGRQLGYPKEKWDRLTEAEKLRVYQEAVQRHQQQQQQQQAGGGGGTAPGPTQQLVPRAPSGTVGGGGAQPKKGKLDGDCCLIATFTPHQILRHMTSLREDFNANETADSIRAHVSPFMNMVLATDYAWIFNVPVDPVRLNLPDYFDVVKKPMDLGTIRKRLDSGFYRTVKAFFSDVRLVWSNALAYNPPGSEVHIIAAKMQRGSETYLKGLETKWLERHAQRVSTDNCCSLCGGGEFPLEPPTLYCNQCSSRIKKGVQYYTTVSNKYHLCTVCYTTARRTGLDLHYDGQHTKVGDLAKKKIESDDREPWVECDNCKKWQHQVCTLYNGRRCEGTTIPHYCPSCLLGHITARGTAQPIAKPIRGAKALPTSRLSDLIESRLRSLLEARRGVLAAEQEVEPAAVELPDLTVRLVSCIDKTLLVQPEFYERYRALGYPSQFNYRSKALMLWQKLGGVDVFIYGVFVQEYGDDCPLPNRRSAYLSYLDSAKYLDPPALRTEVYHEILIAYLDDLRMRGFNQLTLWSCPPLKGDDYILYVHPEEQKTPKADRLRDWYFSMLDAAQRRGIIEKVAFMCDDFFPSIGGREGGLDRHITQLPYCDGDYWPGVAETYSKALRDGTMAPARFVTNPPPGLGANPDGSPQLTQSMSGPQSHAQSEASWAHYSASWGAGADGRGGSASQRSSSSSAGVGDEDEDEDEGGGGGRVTPAGEPGAAASAWAMDPKAAAAAAAAATGGGGGGRSAGGGGKKKKKSGGGGGGGRRGGGGGGGAARAGVKSGGQELDASGLRSYRGVLGVGGRPIPFDPLRDKVGELLVSMGRDFMVVKLRPSCQNCKRYITGAPGLDLKYRCIECAKVDAVPLCPPPPTSAEALRKSGRMSVALQQHSHHHHPHHHHHSGGGGGYGGGAHDSLQQHGGSERIKVVYELCGECYAREHEAWQAGRSGTLHHEHEISNFRPIAVELAPGLLRTPPAPTPASAAGAAAAAMSSSGGALPPTGASSGASSSSSTSRGDAPAGVKAEPGAAEANGALKTEPASGSGASLVFTAQPAPASSTAAIVPPVATVTLPATGSAAAGTPVASSSPVAASTPSSSSSSAAAGACAAAASSLSPDGYLVDPDPPLESPFFHSRQAFLNLCQGNHYQFDQLRRAMHSSYMILWHMHHPTAPSFVHACNVCSALILKGSRWACSVCDEFDLCDECNGRCGSQHEHRLVAIPVVGLTHESVSTAAAVTPASSYAQMLQQLYHAACCTSGPACAQAPCPRFKMWMHHYDSCQVGLAPPQPPPPPPGAPPLAPIAPCTSCRHMHTLLTLHARKCTLLGPACPVRHCAGMKEQLRRAGSSQQAMDARRRAAQTAKATNDTTKTAQMNGDDPAEAAAAAATAAAASATAAGAAAAAAAAAPGGGGGGGSAFTDVTPSAATSAAAAASSSSLVAMKGGKGPRGGPGGLLEPAGWAAAGGDGSSSSGADGTPSAPGSLDAVEASVQASIAGMLETYAFVHDQWAAALARHEAEAVRAHVAEQQPPPPQALGAEVPCAALPPFSSLSQKVRVQCHHRAYRSFMQRINEMYQERKQSLEAQAMMSQAAAGVGAGAGAGSGAAAASSSLLAARASGALEGLDGGAGGSSSSGSSGSHAVAPTPSAVWGQAAWSSQAPSTGAAGSEPGSQLQGGGPPAVAAAAAGSGR